MNTGVLSSTVFVGGEHIVFRFPFLEVGQNRFFRTGGGGEAGGATPAGGGGGGRMLGVTVRSSAAPQLRSPLVSKAPRGPGASL